MLQRDQGSTLLQSAIFQLDHFGILLSDWKSEWHSSLGSTLDLAWECCGSSRHMLRFLVVLDHPEVRPKRPLHRAVFLRRLGIFLPRPFEIREIVPQLPGEDEVLRKWRSRGAQYHV